MLTFHLTIARHHIIEQIDILLAASEINGSRSGCSKLLTWLIAPDVCSFRQMLVVQRQKGKCYRLVIFHPLFIPYPCLQLIAPRWQGIDILRNERLVRCLLALKHDFSLREDFVFHLRIHRYVHQIAHAEGQLLGVFLDHGFSFPIGDEELQRRTAQRQIQRAFLCLACQAGHIGRHLVSVIPTPHAFLDREEIHRYFETSFIIGHSLTGHPIRFCASYSPIAVFQSDYLVFHLRALYRCSGKGTCHSRHKNGIACPIACPDGIESHLESRTLVFLHTEIAQCTLCLQAPMTHLSRLRQLERTREASIGIGLDFPLLHQLAIRIHQANGIS